MSVISKFRIDVPQSRIDRLRAKLVLTDFPDEIKDERDWVRGPPLADVVRLTDYWLKEFDWRKAEEGLNEFPQFIFKVEVEGYGEHEIHFVHQKSTCPNAVPLLFVHGWPGSFFEVTKILPQLVKGGDEFPAFDVVAPSLVNFGFSDASEQRDWQIEQHAEVCQKLMLELGYEEYVVQGGDIGYFVGRSLAMTYPGSVKAQHFNMIVPSLPPPEPPSNGHVQIPAASPEQEEYERLGKQHSDRVQRYGTGYYQIQATKPQTIGYSVADSPVGLLSWIYDKLHDWTDSYHWTEDEVLTWVSIYWFSRAGPAASQRIYYETHHRIRDDQHSGPSDGPPQFWMDLAKFCNVPLGVSRFPREVAMFPRAWHDSMGPIVFWRDHSMGGHFAAYENPDTIVNDLRTMFSHSCGAYGVVKGRNGYS